jgi:hypothetical protein
MRYLGGPQATDAYEKNAIPGFGAFQGMIEEIVCPVTCLKCENDLKSQPSPITGDAVVGRLTGYFSIVRRYGHDNAMMPVCCQAW